MYSNEILTSHYQCWYLFALVNTASVGQQVWAVVFLTSVDSLLCPASIFSLPPSANCVLLWTDTSSPLFSSVFLCQLVLSVFSGTFLPLSHPVSREISPSDPLCGFRFKTKRFSYRHQHKGKLMLPIASHFNNMKNDEINK